MPGDLFAIKNAIGQRPHQDGTAEGDLNGTPVVEPVTWLIDSGAEIGAVRKYRRAQFSTTPYHAYGGQGAGGNSGISVHAGIEVVLEGVDPAGGAVRLSSTRPVGVWNSSRPSEVIGMDQLEEMNATLTWDPASGTGSLAT